MIHCHRSFVLLLPALVLSASLFGSAPCRAAPLTVLHAFGAGGADDLDPSHHKNADGARPEAPLTQGQDGALYGSTPSGGAQGTGVLFRINPDGTGFTLLHSFGPLKAYFVNAASPDGAWPAGALVQAPGGALYGATTQGGRGGSGTVFTVSPDGAGFKVLHAFGPKGDAYQNGDGARPAGLTLGGDGLLYGAATLGGDGGNGLIFRLNRDGTGFKVLHRFREVTAPDNVNGEGAKPGNAPVFGLDGALYGTTNIGGRHGYGVIYRLTADGKIIKALHHFQRTGPGSEANGVFPKGPLTPSPDGFLYGSTQQGGAGDAGVLFRVGQGGAGFTVLHTFSRSEADADNGWLPGAAPLLGSDGQLYGATSVGGAGGVGTLFWASRDGAKFVVLHDFGPSDAARHNADGASAGAKLIQGAGGALYGVTAGCGPNGNGTVFRLVPPQAR